ncbi:SH3 domain-containing protein 2 isoform X2 [Selaginella moellendorffii]|uniref:SH3 domain-containing protein 2 isoform X2 n=1 Tax=Selaginella moellendorffii TaxID=88036 RepID=UPI000D1CC1BA|nr:SH3 domain-containing protein 2 isoform X2 [Selaginella moellendorffii]|eukprot:XP_024544961.1 SH3 domain-containing protein 2 isoform X2 [Selaginella moellendorffii]
MDAIRKQASKFREQVAKQQQAVFKQFSQGYGGSQGTDIVTNEAEQQRHQQLERLFISTRAGKHFQREIVRGTEGLISTGSKQLDVSTKLAEDCRKYAAEGPAPNGALAKSATYFGNARLNIEKERDSMHRALGTQVAEPLRAMVMGAPLEDARHLAQRYDRLRQEAEAQGQEVTRRRSKETGLNADNALKLQMAESKLTELMAAMTELGKEAAAAMTAVEAQQQRLTLQRLIAMVEAERAYHQRVTDILDKLHTQMVAERLQGESGASQQLEHSTSPPPYEEVKENGGYSNVYQSNSDRKSSFFLAEVMHPFEAESEGELTIAVGDYVVVRQVSTTGWSEGECRGKAGWFPSAYVERRQRVPASKVQPCLCPM